MILRTRYGQNQEIRTAAEFGNTDPLRFRLMNTVSSAGVTVTNDKIFGVPAILECIRLVSVNLAQLQVIVYDESDPINRVPAIKAWQYDLLHRNPGLDTNAFDFYSDISSCIEGCGNAFIQKLKYQGKVVEMKVIDPNAVQIRNEKGTKLFDAYLDPKRTIVTKGLTTDDILHIRNFSVNGKMSGFSPMHMKSAAGNILALQEWTGRMFANDATPAGYISVPGNMDRNSAQEMLEIWEEEHGGLSNTGRPAILWNDAKWNAVGIDMVAAQAIESQRFNIEEGARMMSVPVELLQPSVADASKTEEIALRFLTFYLMPRIERIKAAFNSDQDLFGGTSLCVDMPVNAMLRADAVSQAVHDLKMRQGGIMTANEIRATKGLPPHDDGNVLLAIPVGAGALGNQSVDVKGNPQPDQENPGEDKIEPGEEPADKP